MGIPTPYNLRVFGKIVASGLLSGLMILPMQAFARLGASLDSVKADQVQMKATMVVSAKPLYAVHELKSPIGVVIREYVSLEGRVFAVAWQGHFMPQMKLILGSYFEKYSLALRQQPQVRRPFLNVNESNLVIDSVGHLREYSGRAYDPTLIPCGVSPDDLQ